MIEHELAPDTIILHDSLNEKGRQTNRVLLYVFMRLGHGCSRRGGPGLMNEVIQLANPKCPGCAVLAPAVGTCSLVGDDFDDMAFRPAHSLIVLACKRVAAGGGNTERLTVI